MQRSRLRKHWITSWDTFLIFILMYSCIVLDLGFLFRYNMSVMYASADQRDKFVNFMLRQILFDNLSCRIKAICILKGTEWECRYCDGIYKYSYPLFTQIHLTVIMFSTALQVLYWTVVLLTASTNQSAYMCVYLLLLHVVFIYNQLDVISNYSYKKQNAWWIFLPAINDVFTATLITHTTY